MGKEESPCLALPRFKCLMVQVWRGAGPSRKPKSGNKATHTRPLNIPPPPNLASSLLSQGQRANVCKNCLQNHNSVQNNASSFFRELCVGILKQLVVSGFRNIVMVGRTCGFHWRQGNKIKLWWLLQGDPPTSDWCW